MKVIKLKYKEKVYDCLLDDEDYLYFNQWNWCYQQGYARRNRQKREGPGSNWIHLHREILIRAGFTIPVGYEVDHIDRNRCNNCKSNLRIVTRSLNALNVSEDVKRQRQKNTAKMTKIAALLPRTEVQMKNAKDRAFQINKQGKNRHYGNANYMSKRIVDINTGIIYTCIREAAEKHRINYSTLKSQLNGRNSNKTSLRYHV